MRIKELRCKICYAKMCRSGKEFSCSNLHYKIFFERFSEKSLLSSFAYNETESFHSWRGQLPLPKGKGL